MYQLFRKLNREDCKFKASLGYRGNSRPAWATEEVQYQFEQLSKTCLKNTYHRGTLNSICSPNTSIAPTNTHTHWGDLVPSDNDIPTGNSCDSSSTLGATKEMSARETYLSSPQRTSRFGQSSYLLPSRRDGLPGRHSWGGLRGRADTSRVRDILFKPSSIWPALAESPAIACGIYSLEVATRFSSPCSPIPI